MYRTIRKWRSSEFLSLPSYSPGFTPHRGSLLQEIVYGEPESPYGGVVKATADRLSTVRGCREPVWTLRLSSTRAVVMTPAVGGIAPLRLGDSYV